MGTLKQIMLGRERQTLTEKLAAIEKERESVNALRLAWQEREKKALQALEELNEHSTDEERKAFEDEAAEIEKEDGEIREKETDLETRTKEANERIKQIDGELEDIRKRFEEGSKKVTEQEKKPEKQEERGVYVGMDKRERIVELVKREDVKNFLAGVKGMQQRGVSGAELTIPPVMLPLISEVSGEYSVLEKYLNVENVSGDAVQNILAATPEAVWTETKGWIKELDLHFYQMKTSGSKVAGFIPLHISDMEDSEENLAAIVINALGKSIGLAKDKAVLYGNGVNMPIGIATRLAATTQPSWWDTQWVGENRPAFTNIAASHIGAVSAENVEGVDLYKEMLAVLGNVKRKYEVGSGGKFWAMASTTWTYLQTHMLTLNTAGAVVSSANRQMPVIGGAVEELDFIPDGVIIGGFGGNYKWVNRRGVKISVSEHVRFLQDQVLYKGTARADGMPMAGEAFAMFNVKSTAVPTATMEFSAGKTSKEETALGDDE